MQQKAIPRGPAVKYHLTALRRVPERRPLTLLYGVKKRPRRLLLLPGISESLPYLYYLMVGQLTDWMAQLENWNQTME